MTAKRLILAVDRNRRNLELLAQFLGKEGYQVIPVDSYPEFDQALTRVQEIGLALLDVAGFDPSIWERCERLRGEKIPFLVLSSRQSSLIQRESLAHGARSVLVKPLVIKELLSLIHSLLAEGI